MSIHSRFFESIRPTETPRNAPRFVHLIAGMSLLVALGLVLYREFVFGNSTLLYKDVGSDSINISYPYYVLLSDYLRHTGIPSWSFNVGMGQDLFPWFGTMLLNPAIWVTKEAIAKTLVYQHLLYIVLVAWLFWQFLHERGLSFESSFLGAMLLSFSAYMCMGSCWYFHANEVVCFTFLLFAAERAVTRGQWFYLALAVAVIGFLGVFHVYLSALLLSLYVPARLIEKYPSRFVECLPALVFLAVAAFLGVGLGAIITLDNFYAVLNSPRGSGTIAGSWPIPAPLQIESLLYYLTAALRTFSNDILGIGSDFRGWGNYLEAPINYAGLICLLIFPQIFVGASWKQRGLYCGFILFVLLPIILPWFRYLFWVFRGGYFRTFSLFSIFGIITLSMGALSRYRRGRTLNIWLLAAPLLLFLSTLYLPIRQMEGLVDAGPRQTIAILLIIYAGLLAIGQVIKRQGILTSVIIAVTAGELVYLGQMTVSNRPTVTKQELNERVGYNDMTVDAVREIEAKDTSFFRITKTWGSGPAIYSSLNDAMVFGYYGTSSYSSFNNLNYIRFLMAVDAIKGPDFAIETQWSKGLIGEPLLSIFACEKYVLTKTPVPFETADHYEFVKRYGDTYLFRNRLFLPFGLTFNRYISETAFLQLPASAKPQALLHSVVISNKEPDGQGLSELPIDKLQSEIIASSLSDIVMQLHKTALDIRSFSQERIVGSVRLDEKSILVLQTPFDLGWRAYEDGKSLSVLRVDIGLMGVVLERGEHEVEFRYRPPFLISGAVISTGSLLILSVAWWRWPRVRLPASPAA